MLTPSYIVSESDPCIVRRRHGRILCRRNVMQNSESQSYCGSNGLNVFCLCIIPVSQYTMPCKVAVIIHVQCSWPVSRSSWITTASCKDSVRYFGVLEKTETQPNKTFIYKKPSARSWQYLVWICETPKMGAKTIFYSDCRLNRHCTACSAHSMLPVLFTLLGFTRGWEDVPRM
jgi:hypothetical protein